MGLEQRPVESNLQATTSEELSDGLGDIPIHEETDDWLDLG